MTDTELIDWMEQQDGIGLISDDLGHWCATFDGVQSIPNNLEEPADIATSFFITKDQWKPSIREAIKSIIEETTPPQK